MFWVAYVGVDQPITAQLARPDGHDALGMSQSPDEVKWVDLQAGLGPTSRINVLLRSPISPMSRSSFASMLILSVRISDHPAAVFAISTSAGMRQLPGFFTLAALLGVPVIALVWLAGRRLQIAERPP